MVAPDSEGGNIRIDQIRELTHWIRLTPYLGGRKIGLIEEVDRLTEEALYALLKLVEEPPDKSVLIFTSSAFYRLPATLVSRCQLVRCLPQGIGRVADQLQEKEKLPAHEAQALASWSGGRIGLALHWLREKGLDSKNALLDELLAAIRRKAVETPLGNAPRPQVEQALDGIAAWWRDLLLLQLGADPSWIIHQDRLGDLRRDLSSQHLSSGSTEILLRRIERTYLAQEAVRQNASPRMALAVAITS